MGNIQTIRLFFYIMNMRGSSEVTLSQNGTRYKAAKVYDDNLVLIGYR